MFVVIFRCSNLSNIAKKGPCRFSIRLTLCIIWEFLLMLSVKIYEESCDRININTSLWLSDRASDELKRNAKLIIQHGILRNAMDIRG